MNWSARQFEFENKEKKTDNVAKSTQDGYAEFGEFHAEIHSVSAVKIIDATSLALPLPDGVGRRRWTRESAAGRNRCFSARGPQARDRGGSG
jgi:hypothetical protein